MACIEKEPVNTGNFLRWHKAVGLSVPVAGCPQVCGPEPSACDIYHDYSAEGFLYALPAVNADIVKFFINSRVPFDYPEQGTLRLGLLFEGKLAKGGLTPSFLLDSIDPQKYYIHGSLYFDCLRDGYYNPVLYRAGTEEILLVATPFYVCNRQRWEKDTVWVKWRHTGSMAGFRYRELPDYFNETRLDLSMHRPKLPETSETYRDENGRTRSASLEISRTYEVETDFWDEGAYEAAAIMLMSSDVFIGGKRVKKVSAFDPEYFDDGSLVAKTTVEDQDFTLSVSNCV